MRQFHTKLCIFHSNLLYRNYKYIITSLFREHNIKKFKTPVIITLEKDKEFIKKHYINDGFSDYLLKSDIDNELKRIMDRYYFYK